jgi:hypothetical protein
MISSFGMAITRCMIFSTRPWRCAASSLDHEIGGGTTRYVVPRTTGYVAPRVYGYTRAPRVSEPRRYYRQDRAGAPAPR